MSREFIFSPESLGDLRKLYNDIAQNAGTERARIYTNRITSTCLNLAPFPERGKCRDDLRPGLRILGFRRRVAIAFHITSAEVIIDRILYGGRSLDELFSKEDQ